MKKRAGCRVVAVQLTRLNKSGKLAAVAKQDLHTAAQIFAPRISLQIATWHKPRRYVVFLRATRTHGDCDIRRHRCVLGQHACASRAQAQTVWYENPKMLPYLPCPGVLATTNMTQTWCMFTKDNASLNHPARYSAAIKL